MDATQAGAAALLESLDVPWLQRFELAPGVFTPGSNDIAARYEAAGIGDLTGTTVLEVGTNNGGAAFEAERRGASRVLATDVVPADVFGFDRLAAFLDSSVEYRVCSVYELASIAERFDLVLFYGVLYHLRHPLLALDALRDVVADDGIVLLETAVADRSLRWLANRPISAFHPGAELNNDHSNWFVPTARCVEAWADSAGFDTEPLGPTEPTLSQMLAQRRVSKGARRSFRLRPRASGDGFSAHSPAESVSVAGAMRTRDRP